MKKLIEELSSIAKRMEKIRESSILAVMSVDYWTEKSEEFFREIESLDEEYHPEEEAKLNAAIRQTQFLSRRIDIEMEILTGLDVEFKSLEKRRDKILKILKA